MDAGMIGQFLNQHIPNVIAIYQFGSQAHGTARPTSDLDVAVLARDPIPAEQRFHLAQDLAAQLHRDVDLLDLRTASTVMRMQVLATGQCLETRDDQAKAEFEMYAYADYARLNEERRELVQGIQERGLVYG
ncbi:MAG: putative Nucleotidyltransferase [Nitrospira sp.]|jgi:predicted nucleotidyltransferase|nr:putative Nucleotidyltransferase [Nitrospira sp.]